MPNQFGFSIDSEITPPQKQFKVLLIGDTCIDEYIYGMCERLNPEAPVPILKYSKTERKSGMAWNVKNNLQSFDVDVCILTHKENIIKSRYIDKRYNQQILRVDCENYVKPMDYEISYEGYDAVVISDYDKGFLTSQKITEIVTNAKIPVFIDSKKTSLPKSNCFIKINDSELKLLNGSYDNIIVTRGSNGADYQGKNYSGFDVGVFDVCGAGDTFLSALVYFYLKYGRIERAIPYANKAASIAVSNFGTYVLTEKDIKEINDI